MNPELSAALSDLEERRNRVATCIAALIALVGSALGVIGPLLAKPIEQFTTGDWIGLTGCVLATLE